jgi:hypothetical protein
MRAGEAPRRGVTQGAAARAAARRARCELQGNPAPGAPKRSVGKIPPGAGAEPRNGSARSRSPSIRCRQLCAIRRILPRRRCRPLAEPIRGASRPGSSAPATPATTPGGCHSESPRRFVETPAPLTHSTPGYCAIASAPVKQIDGTTARDSLLPLCRSARIADRERSEHTSRSAAGGARGARPVMEWVPRAFPIDAAAPDRTPLPAVH